ncbi:MAG: hypothetical protein M0P59_05220 [Gallionella sp.]|jgi:hypothetical protein|nr:hypothetical protein [Gallionella sp.]MCK9353544.1 hypothetical protein [Gallionella sp.]
MKKLTLLLGGSLLAAAFAMPVHADEYGKPGPGMMKGEGRMGMMKGECMMDMQGMRGDCPMMGAHVMTGMIDKVDHAKGTLMLKHSAADMMLHFPPDAIKDLKNGDTITVKLGFTKSMPTK